MSTKNQKNIFRLAAIAAAVLAVQSFAALPEIRITTQSNSNPDQQGSGSSWRYVGVSKIEITGGSYTLNRSGKADSVKVRGNSTAGLTKKPYKIKFADKVPLFGDTAAKSWVLLANYYDATFALNAMAFELGKRLNLEFTNRYWFVDVYINNTYKGIYQLTEQVQSNPGRVDLREKHRGWLAEFDYHDPSDNAERNTFFTTSKFSIKTYVKSPELDDTVPNRPASYIQFVKDDVNKLVNKMSEGGFPTNGYRDLIDLESFAKYVLIQLVMDNFDFNSKAQDGYLLGSNYCYRMDSASTTRIKAGPLWDFDLAAGINRTAPIGGGGTAQSTFPNHYKTFQDSIAPTHAFYRKLWDDPAFKAKYYKLWLKHKKDFQDMSGVIDNVKSQVEGSISSKGNNIWNNYATIDMCFFNCDPNKPKEGPLTTSTFNTEVQNLKSWWTSRLNFVDQKLKSYNIDTTKDVIQSAPPTPPKSPTSVVSRFGKSGSSLSVVKNGLRINAAGTASMKVFTLSGDVVRKQTFTAGSHAVKLGDLPRGVYLARVNLDGVKQTVKVAVR